MPRSESGLPLEVILADLADEVTVVHQAERTAVSVTGVSVWLPGDSAALPFGALVICPSTRHQAKPWDDVAPLLESGGVAALLVWARPGTKLKVPASVSVPVLLAGDGREAGSLVLRVAQAITNPLESTSRRLTALQRSLTQALSEASPTSAIVSRLGKICNASSTVIAVDGRQLQATGALPQALLFDEIRRAPVDTQSFSIDGWLGVAVRINDPIVENAQFGWIIAASRRPGFPDPYAVSAVQLAASLVETSLRIDVLARSQERAVQSALLEQALSLEVRRDDRELESKLNGLGMRFDDELRVVVVRPLRQASGLGQPAPSPSELATRASEAFTRNGIACLASSRDKSGVLLVRCSAATASRLLMTRGTLPTPLLVGIGRAPRSVGEVSDSFHDAQLAVQALRSRRSGTGIMTFEDFDFATRLFADVGLERMTAWALAFLAPLQEREALLDGLKAFFDHDQNVNVAASALNIHHNSLRYRLAKVEELLRISLRNPAAISSVYLALTALELGLHSQRRSLEGTARTPAPSTHDVEAPRAAAGAWDTRPDAAPGVVLSPDR